MAQIQTLANIGSVIELKYIGDDKRPVAQFRAYMINSKTKGEERIDRGEWINVSLWGSCAEAASKLFSVGDCIYLVGEMGTDRWHDDKKDEDANALKVDARLALPYLPYLDALTYQPRKGKADPSSDADDQAA
ncbi:MAG: single-stranded DNA-binding protein [Gammaproteobacteria bacterium]